MKSAPRTSRAQAIAIPRPAVAVAHESLVLALVVALLVAGLLLP
jgi:hypothetical protein